MIMIKHMLIVLGLASCAAVVSGCGQAALRPTDREVEAFIARREFALTQTWRLPPAMAGTSYTGITKQKYEHPKSESFIIGPPHDHVRFGVAKQGHWSADHGFRHEFDVTLEENLVKSTDIGEIAQRLNKHYASELIRRGWHVVGLSTGGNGSEEKHRIWVTYVWSDLGKAIGGDGTGGSIDYSVTNDDIRRGYFKAMIAVCVDTYSRRAHILMNLYEQLGA